MPYSDIALVVSFSLSCLCFGYAVWAHSKYARARSHLTGQLLDEREQTRREIQRREFWQAKYKELRDRAFLRDSKGRMRHARDVA